MAKGRDQRSEVGGQRPEVGGQRSEAPRYCQVTVTWNPANDLPDDDITVLVCFGDDEVELGYHDDGRWRRCYDESVIESVTHWAHPPMTPTQIAAADAATERRAKELSK